MPDQLQDGPDIVGLIRPGVAGRVRDSTGAPLPVQLVNHHDSHAASAFWASGYERALVVTLDGEGDEESGSVTVIDRDGSQLRLARFSVADSIGYIYSFVTKRYGFRISRHKGKITGLAALGAPRFTDRFLAALSVVEGSPRNQLSPDGLGQTVVARLRRKTGAYTGFARLVDELAAEPAGFADLAASVQEATEAWCLAIVHHWRIQTGIRNIALAGGVFANVRVNQRIIEESGADRVFIYPNMGDGGIGVGAAWVFLRASGEVPTKTEFTPYLGSLPGNATHTGQVTFESMDMGSCARLAATAIDNGGIVGLIEGRMEWGPRALGARSILADPRDRSINDSLNARLARPEFMPFAPAVLERDSSSVFQLKAQDVRPYHFMTATCSVHLDWRDKIPAVVHLDGTARPQIVNEEAAPLYAAILREFMGMTGVPVLVNTSFNAHEEPIVESLDDALRSMEGSTVDIVVTPDGLYRMNSAHRR